MIPAAVVTAVRGRWLYFWCGWLTLGLIWFIGALAPDPDDPPRDRRLIVAVVGATAAALLVLGLFGARPSPVLGLDDMALQNSVGSENGYGISSRGCQSQPDGTWRCSRHDDGYSGTVTYEVRSNGLGCWHAVRVGGPGEGSSKRLSGCVTLFDFVF